MGVSQYCQCLVVTVVDESESTALGAALPGGVADGLWPNIEAAVAGLDRREHQVEPEDDLSRIRNSLFCRAGNCQYAPRRLKTYVAIARCGRGIRV